MIVGNYKLVIIKVTKINFGQQKVTTKTTLINQNREDLTHTTDFASDSKKPSIIGGMNDFVV